MAPQASPPSAVTASTPGSGSPSASAAIRGAPPTTKHSAKVRRRGSRAPTRPATTVPAAAHPAKTADTRPRTAGPPASAAHSGSSTPLSAASIVFVRAIISAIARSSGSPSRNCRPVRSSPA